MSSLRGLQSELYGGDLVCAASDHQGTVTLQPARFRSLARCPTAAASRSSRRLAAWSRDPVPSPSRLSARVLAAHAARSVACADRRRDVLEPRGRLNGSLL